MPFPQEQPSYVLPQSKKRAATPKMISLIVLGGIFYLGIMLNLALLELDKDTNSLVKLLSLIFLLMMLSLGTFLTIHHANSKYYFYREKIIFNKKEIYYKDIINTEPKRDFFDKLLKSYSINLGHDFVIRHVPNNINMKDYIGRLVSYTRQQY
jgi:hypothetical protein